MSFSYRQLIGSTNKHPLFYTERFSFDKRNRKQDISNFNIHVGVLPSKQTEDIHNSFTGPMQIHETSITIYQQFTPQRKYI